MKREIPSYRTFRLLYLLILALLLTALFGGKATHQGMVLGLVSICTGLMIIYRCREKSQFSRLVGAAIFVVIEIIACIVVIVGNDPTELWFASFYAVFAGLMVLEKLILHWLERDRGW